MLQVLRVGERTLGGHLLATAPAWVQEDVVVGLQPEGLRVAQVVVEPGLDGLRAADLIVELLVEGCTHGDLLREHRGRRTLAVQQQPVVALLDVVVRVDAKRHDFRYTAKDVAADLFRQLSDVHLLHEQLGTLLCVECGVAPRKGGLARARYWPRHRSGCWRGEGRRRRSRASKDPGGVAALGLSRLRLVPPRLLCRLHLLPLLLLEARLPQPRLNQRGLIACIQVAWGRRRGTTDHQQQCQRYLGHGLG
mmetsp:Transcript_33477/g.85622  ORF Transcript_33477/g.85622 Transcript_33477/m.85622 type:complete len:250 (+) Transcript_33477:2098-2847(+)